MENQITYQQTNHVHLFKLLSKNVQKDVQDELHLLLNLLVFQEGLGNICLPLICEDLFILWDKYIEKTFNDDKSIDKKKESNDIEGYSLERPDKQIQNLCKKEFILLNFSNLISDGNAFTPFVYIVKNENLFLYSQKNFSSYKYILTKCKTLLEKETTYKTKELSSVIEQVFKRYPIKNNNKNLEYHILQKRAIYFAIKFNFSIITGGPGTGKTSVILNAIRCLIRLNYTIDDIVLCSPTGRATGRLLESIILSNNQTQSNSFDKEIINIKANTIHRLLGHDPIFDTWKYNTLNPLPYSVVIVDETSMIDLHLMSRLLEAITTDTKLIFVGDDNQLPSIEPGNVLSDFINMNHPYDPEQNEIYANEFHELFALEKDDEEFILYNNHYTTELIKSHRSKDTISEPCKIIKKGQYPDKLIYNSKAFDFSEADVQNEGIYLVEDKKKFQENLLVHLKKYSEKLLNREYLNLINDFSDSPKNKLELLQLIFKQLDSMRILCLVNNGPSGQLALNDYLIREFRKLNTDTKNIPNGTPVICTKNYAKLGLHNGDLGVILSEQNNDAKIYFLDLDGVKSYKFEQIKSLNLAFAHTVHKSQGSEYNEVFFVLPNKENHPLYSRELLYTAITRAKSRVILFGSVESVKNMINNPLKRQSGPIVTY